MTHPKSFRVISTYPERKLAARAVAAAPLRELTWTHWDLSPGPSACEADVMPLHHVPSYFSILSQSTRCFSRFSLRVRKSVPRAETTTLDTLGIEPRAFRMQSGCDTATPCAHMHSASRVPQRDTSKDRQGPAHKSSKARQSAFTRVSLPSVDETGSAAAAHSKFVCCCVSFMRMNVNLWQMDYYRCAIAIC